MTKRDINPDAGQDHSTAIGELRALVAAGLDALERGEFTEVDDADLDAFLEGLVS